MSTESSQDALKFFIVRYPTRVVFIEVASKDVDATVEMDVDNGGSRPYESKYSPWYMPRYKATQCSPGLSCGSVLHTRRRGLRRGRRLGRRSTAKTPINILPHLFLSRSFIVPVFIFFFSGREVEYHLLVSVDFYNVFKFGIDDDVDCIWQSRSKFHFQSDASVAT